MYARTVTMQVRPARIAVGIAHVRDEMMPTLSSIPGFVGMSLLVDRSFGRCIATSAWKSEEAVHSSASRANVIRDRAMHVFGGEGVVEEWEVTYLRRAKPTRRGAFARVTRLEVDPQRIDQSIGVFKFATLPVVEEFEGFCSASLLVDRASGRGVACVAYDSFPAMQASREPAAGLRTRTARDAGVWTPDVGEYELAIARFAVPDTQ